MVSHHSSLRRRLQVLAQPHFITWLPLLNFVHLYMMSNYARMLTPPKIEVPYALFVLVMFTQNCLALVTAQAAVDTQHNTKYLPCASCVLARLNYARPVNTQYFLQCRKRTSMLIVLYSNKRNKLYFSKTVFFKSSMTSFSFGATPFCCRPNLLWYNK